MRFYNSFYAKIFFGYCLVGALFVLLVASALLQFHGLKIQIAEQRQVARFYDDVRYARRMEKNYLLFHKQADLHEAAAKAAHALDAYSNLPALFRGDESGADVYRYHQLLSELVEQRIWWPSQEVQNELYQVGQRLLKTGEHLDAESSRRLASAVAGHEEDLLMAIAVALVLVLLVGGLVTRSIVRPLREIEQRLLRMSGGESRLPESGEQDLEVRSLTASINGALVELERRQQEMARSSRLVAQGTMLSGVAHELNNPLSNISSSCQILQEELAELPTAEVQTLLTQIDEQVLRAQRIVSSLLDFSRDRQAVRQPEAVVPLVNEALRFVAAELGSLPKVSCDIAASLVVEVERSRFQQVLINLIRNAAEASPPGGVVRIAAWRESLPEGDGVTMEVDDQGEGIAPEDLSRVFDPFFTTKPIGQGVGLGLFVAHEIVSQHGGCLQVESEKGHGAHFWLHVPDRRKGECID